MKFNRIGLEDKYGDYLHIYEVNDHKRIHIYTEKDHSITDIYLVTYGEKRDAVSFTPKGLWYVENLTDDKGALDADSLMIMIAQEEHGCVRALTGTESSLQGAHSSAAEEDVRMVQGR